MKKIIGQGRDSIVYACEDNEHIIKKSKKKGINIIELFIKMNLRENEIMTSEDVEIDENNHTQIKEKKGMNIMKCLKKKSFEKKKELCKDICLGIYHLHKYKILHGDIKPLNIILHNKIAKINDFSCSKILSDTYKLRNNCYTNLYRPNDKYLSLKSDIFALGCTIYEILREETLFQELGNDRIKCFQKLEDVNMNKLILSMIREDENERPSIYEVLDFFGIKKEEKNNSNLDEIIYEYCEDKELNIKEIFENINYGIPLKNKKIIKTFIEDNYNFLEIRKIKKKKS